jgi:hypothetical protein
LPQQCPPGCLIRCHLAERCNCLIRKRCLPRSGSQKPKYCSQNTGGAVCRGAEGIDGQPITA